MRLAINPTLVVVIIGLGLWQAAGLWGSPLVGLTGTPLSVAQAFGSIIASQAMWINLGTTVFELIFGLLLAICIGLVVSLAFGTEALAHDVLGPFFIVGNTVPKVVLLPAFLMLLGIGYASKIAFGALHGVFPIAIIVSNGVKSALSSDQVRAAVSPLHTDVFVSVRSK